MALSPPPLLLLLHLLLCVAVGLSQSESSRVGVLMVCRELWQMELCKTTFLHLLRTRLFYAERLPSHRRSREMKHWLVRFE